MNKKILSIFSAVIIAVIYLSLTAASSGSGVSSAGCSCHGPASANTLISITGFPATYTNGTAYTVTVTVTNATKVGAGFAASVNMGTISAPPTGTTLSGTMAIKHNSNNAMVAGVKAWSFVWTAPATGSATATINVAANAVDNSFGTSGDLWNTATASATGTVVSLPTVTATAGTILCNGSSTTITATGASGTAPYQYKLNSGAYQSSNVLNAVLAGTYTVTVKDNNNVTATTTLSITQPTPINISLTVIGAPCNLPNSGSVSYIITGGVPPYSIPSTGVINNLPVNSVYTFAVSDANGCSQSTSAFITALPATYVLTVDSIINIGCNGAATGKVYTTVGGPGSANLIYTIIPQGTPIGTGDFGLLPAGVYTITGSDGNCFVSTVVIITQTLPINVVTSVTNTTCGAATGSITIDTITGGTPPYSSVIAPGGNFTGLSIGFYTIVVTDSLGCNRTKLVYIASPAPFTLALDSVKNVLCPGDSNGKIYTTVTGSGSFTYSINPAYGTYINNGDYSNLPIGAYFLTVTDTSGCSISISAVIANSSNPLNLSNTVVHVACNGAATGAATFTAFGGSLPYSYAWAAPLSTNTTNTASALPAGAYNCTVTDANGCTKATTVTITQKPPILITTNAIATSCKNGTNGTINAAAAGGTAPLNYNWLPGNATSANINNLGAGVYTLTVVDGNLCSTTSAVIVNNGADTANANFTKTAATLNAIQTGATSYQWFACNPFTPIPNATSATFTPTANGDYGLVVTNNQCKDTSACSAFIMNSIANNNAHLLQVKSNTNGNYIITNAYTQNISYKIINAQGQVISNGSLQLGDNVLEIYNLPNGVYVLQTSLGNKVLQR